MVWKSLRKWMGIMIMGASTFFYPQITNGQQNLLSLDNNVFRSEELTFRGAELKIGHYAKATDGFDSTWDHIYSYPSVWNGEWAPKIVTRIGSNDLDRDLRMTNSFSDFNFDLSVVIQNEQNIFGTNQLTLMISDNSTYDYIPSNEHWTISYNINSNYYTGGASKTDRKNLRDLCPSANLLYTWNEGVGINIPAGDTNSNGEVIFGSGILHKEFNKLISSSTTGGTNNPAGEQILNYGTNKTVALNANPGYHLDYYVLTRTDNTGTVSVVTNDVAGTDVTTTNIPLTDIKGSNNIYAVYAANPPCGFNVAIEDGEKYGLNPTNFTNVSSGGSITSTTTKVYYYPENPLGVRYKLVGLEKKL